ncbi:DUF2786 domain-containing protein [Paenibacillus sp. FSL K6-3166]|uniref:DUF2786 domain-containing protein n=1 Tax=unclassified Paenibacillus TaxID=185978 RepID=UPI000BA11EF5|nr:DUF2786 domain-containing protein [Paenibacillus sp. VTT E-133291]OZQ95831.1 hypothetical protein CA598_08355 [Paenibacillus sp. VTT E-133291]
MYDKEKMLEKLKGLKALAERGVDGEKESAQRMLEKLMEKYGITESDIGAETVEIAWFRYHDDSELRLLNQILYMVLGDCDFYSKLGASKRKHKVLGAYCTAAERLEIELNFDFYKRAMQEELKLFYSAFMNKNKLFPSEEKAKATTSGKALSREEELRLSFMMEGMERRTMTKMIEND